MSREELKQQVFKALKEVAPEIEENDIDPDEALQEECDLDSMDFLKFLEEIKNATGVSVPEADYSKVTTMNDLLAYLEDRMS